MEEVAHEEVEEEAPKDEAEIKVTLFPSCSPVAFLSRGVIYFFNNLAFLVGLLVYSN